MKAWRARWELRRQAALARLFGVERGARELRRARFVGAGVGTLVGSIGLGALVLAAPPSGGPAPAPGAPVALGAAKDFQRTPAEDEVWVLYHEDKLLTARRKVEALLEDDPDSIVGHYILGQVLRRAEASLPRAMRELGKARELYERKHSPNVTNVQSTPWLLHRDILYAAQACAGELERHEYQLDLLDYHDSLYDPRLTAEHAWPLMLSGEFEEAREYAEKATKSRDAFQRSLGRNALCAIEGEAGTRTERFAACLEAYDHAAEVAKGDDPFSRPDELSSTTVHAYNAALAAMSVLRPDEAERLAKAGAARIEFTPANPWRLLVRFYTDQGRGSDAVEALREMQAWRRKQPPNLREQARGETDAAFATLLLVAGETETGLRVIDRAIANPDRRGLTTSSKEQTLGAHALLRVALRRSHAEAEAERAVWSGTAEALDIRTEQARRRMQDWADAERIRGVLHDDDVLRRTFRPYVAGGLEPVPTWLLGDLVDILGPGVVSVVLDDVRAVEAGGKVGEPLSATGGGALEPYLDALEAEIALARGREREALSRAESALESLPEFESLLRARVEAVAAEAALELGKEREALGLLASAMQRDAGIIRRRGLALPATLDIEASGPVAQRVVDLLDDSPRFDWGGAGNSPGFRVAVQGSERSAEVCLLAPEGGVLSCASTPPEPSAEPSTEPGEGAGPIREVDAEGEAIELTDDDYAALTVEAFHRQAFAMAVGLSNVDLGSLDGTATIAEEAARERMHGLLDQMAADEN